MRCARSIFAIAAVAAGLSACAHPRRGPIEGAFLYLGSPEAEAIPHASIESLLDDLRDSGFGSLAVQTLRLKLKSAGCGVDRFEWIPGYPDRLKTLLDAAEKRGMKVYVGLVASSQACRDFETGANPGHVARETELVLDRLGALGLLEHRAIAGWYLPDEPGLGWSRQYAYYQGLVQIVRKHSRLPIHVAPFLDKADHARSPGEVGELARKFQAATGIDVQIWQDSVGAGALSTGERREGDSGSLSEYVAAISAAIGRDHLWMDHELFTWGEPLLGAAAYRPTAVARVDGQLRATPAALVARRFAWLAQRQLAGPAAVDPERAPGSPRLRAAYRALYGLQGDYLRPRSYRWITPPSSEYPDPGSALTDLVAGDPRRPRGGGWVGSRGDTEIVVDLGSRARVDWIAADVLERAREGIAFPEALRVSCSDDGQSWKQESRFPRDVPHADAEYILSNAVPLDWRCRFLRVRLDAGGIWTFVSELEFVSE